MTLKYTKSQVNRVNKLMIISVPGRGSRNLCHFVSVELCLNLIALQCYVLVCFSHQPHCQNVGIIPGNGYKHNNTLFSYIFYQNVSNPQNGTNIIFSLSSNISYIFLLQDDIQ